MTVLDSLTLDFALSGRDAAAHLASLLEATRRRNQAYLLPTDVPPVRSVGIVGAGFMGGAVAASVIASGIPVTVTDTNRDVLAAFRDNIRRAWRLEPQARRADCDDHLRELLTITPDLAQAAACDLVVETIVEHLLHKHRLLAQLDGLCPEQTLLVSNTSTLPINGLSLALTRPERFGGLHYLPQTGEYALIELILGRHTSRAAASRLLRFCERVNRVPVVVPDGRGFLVNRILMAYMSAGMRLLEDGVDILAIDAAATSFGMCLGPIAMYDAIGLDVVLSCGLSLSAEPSSRVVRSPILVRLIKGGQWGCKSGGGFYLHERDDESPRFDRVNPRARQVIDEPADDRLELSATEIAAAVILPMVIEAAAALESGRAVDAGQIDLAVMCGIGFPKRRGGPLCWADLAGPATVLRLLESLRYLGPHLQPTPQMIESAAAGRRYYDLAESALPWSARNAS